MVAGIQTPDVHCTGLTRINNSATNQNVHLIFLCFHHAKLLAKYCHVKSYLVAPSQIHIFIYTYIFDTVSSAVLTSLDTMLPTGVCDKSHKVTQTGNWILIHRDILRLTSNITKGVDPSNVKINLLRFCQQGIIKSIV